MHGATIKIKKKNRKILFNACKSLEAETKLVTGQKWVQARIAHLSWKK